MRYRKDLRRSQTIGGDDRPVFDDAVLETLSASLSRARAHSFVQRALAWAKGALRELEANDGDAEECEQIAHRLKGTAASVGLARIALEASEIEVLARGAAPVTALRLQRLSAAIKVSRLELARRFPNDAAAAEGSRNPHRRSTVSANR